MNTLRKVKFLLGISVTLFFLNSCKNNSENKDKKEEKPQEYQYIITNTGQSTVMKEYPARLEGMQNIEIRPKIDGFIDQVYIDEGNPVRAGQPLFRIRNPQYEQLLRSAQAAMKSAQANVDAASMQVTKTKPLVDKDIISPYELKSAQLNLQAQKAAYAQAQANLVNAQVNQGYTLITSPVNGVIGRLPYKTGSYVSSTSANPLTTVSNISKIFAYFSINEKDQIEFLKHSKGATIAEKLKNLPMVSLILSDGSVYDQKGKIETLSGQVDPNTGSFQVRAAFNNENGLLRSGYSATIQIPNNIDNAVIIPQKATFEIQGKTFVYTVEADSKVKSTEVKIEPLSDGLTAAVLSGVKAGEKVVIEGVGLLKDGTVIIPKKTTLQAAIAPQENK